MRASSALTGLTAPNRLEEDATNTMACDVLAGLRAQQKYIPSKYFYDARGSKLFELICNLPEYYPTKIELRLLCDHAKEIVRGIGHGDLVELGSGANWKIRTLLEALGRRGRTNVRYMPVDVCASALTKSAAELTTLYPELKVNGIVADFTCDLHCVQSNRPKLVLFFGSTIGNLNEREASSFLKSVAATLNPGDRFLLGLDMVKPIEIIEAAYNDSQGLTAEFNKNMLLVINRELRANFKPDSFDHVAFFNSEDERVEMHLRANRDIWVEVKAIAASFVLRKGETIRTEICCKFSRDGAEKMIRDAGMKVSRWYSDPRGWFSLLEAVLSRP
ncbi:MAG: L-histidine N(alpha)-methyltransferase [Desulfomonilaceae bacterium]